MILLADSEGPDQTARMRSLIWAFAVRKYPKSRFRMAGFTWQPRRSRYHTFPSTGSCSKLDFPKYQKGPNGPMQNIHCTLMKYTGRCLRQIRYRSRWVKCDSAMQGGKVLRNNWYSRYSTVDINGIWHGMSAECGMGYNAIQWSTIHCNAIHYSTIQHNYYSRNSIM